MTRCTACGGDGDYLDDQGMYLDANGNRVPEDEWELDGRVAPCPRCHGSGLEPDKELGGPIDWETPTTSIHYRRNGADNGEVR